MHNTETLSDQAVVAPPTAFKVILEVTKRARWRVYGKASGIWPRRPGTEVIGFQELKSQSHGSAHLQGTLGNVVLRCARLAGGLYQVVQTQDRTLNDPHRQEQE